MLCIVIPSFTATSASADMLSATSSAINLSCSGEAKRLSVRSQGDGVSWSPLAQ